MSKIYKNQNIVACLDIGSSKMLCIIASINIDGIEILGYSHKESKGISFGAISDVKLAQKSIANTVAEAERMAGLNVDEILIGISGSQVFSKREDVTTKISKELVRQLDIFQAVDKVRNDYNKIQREAIHIIPLQYRIDDSPALENPRHLIGEKLFSRFHVVSASKNIISNIENCLKNSQLSVSSFMAETYASALASLSDNEVNVGSLLIDIGGSSTSFCLFYNGKLFYIGSILMGGSNVTKDISAILSVRFDIAEKIKNLNNTLIISPIEEKEIIKFKNADNNEENIVTRISREDLRNIIESRLAEILESVKNHLEKNNISLQMIPNIVLTGGAAATIGIDKLAGEIFKKNVRIGYPAKFNLAPSELVNTSSTCALGMLIFLRNNFLNDRGKITVENKGSWFKKFLDKIINV